MWCLGLPLLYRLVYSTVCTARTSPCVAPPTGARHARHARHARLPSRLAHRGKVRYLTVALPRANHSRQPVQPATPASARTPASPASSSSLSHQPATSSVCPSAHPRLSRQSASHSHGRDLSSPVPPAVSRPPSAVLDFVGPGLRASAEALVRRQPRAQGTLLALASTPSRLHTTAFRHRSYVCLRAPAAL